MSFLARSYFINSSRSILASSMARNGLHKQAFQRLWQPVAPQLLSRASFGASAQLSFAKSPKDNNKAGGSAGGAGGARSSAIGGQAHTRRRVKLENLEEKEPESTTTTSTTSPQDSGRAWKEQQQQQQSTATTTTTTKQSSRSEDRKREVEAAKQKKARELRKSMIAHVDDAADADADADGTKTKLPQTGDKITSEGMPDGWTGFNREMAQLVHSLQVRPDQSATPSQLEKVAQLLNEMSESQFEVLNLPAQQLVI